MVTKRMDWIDTAKGIGIFLVVWGHFYASDTLKIAIYGFHMPLFLFLSGYLYKQKDIRFLAFLRKKSKRLLVPFFLFQTVTFLVVNGLSFLASHKLYESPTALWKHFFYLDGDVGFNTPLWFLVVLFFVEILFYLFMQMRKGQLIVIILFCALAIMFSEQEGMRIFLGFQIVPLSWLFYYFGFKCKAWGLLVHKRWHNWYVLLVMSLIYVLIVFYLNNAQIVGFRSNNIGNLFIFMVGALLGIYTFCILCQKIGKSALWGNFGRHSMIIMGTHYFFLIFYANTWRLITHETIQQVYPVWTSLLLSVFAFCVYFICFRWLEVRHRKNGSFLKSKYK
ncbi:acyltransferase family protein [Listeria booriae]|uniref:acyltransferase family protein n=1 Tax=Listeria booriae TaxID=1552123 RepID=UPI001623EB64|nr:acyltransferase family protein [Listeria booriae]MBC2021423.1 acyltransferase family protein [Listeria booriae]